MTSKTVFRASFLTTVLIAGLMFWTCAAAPERNTAAAKTEETAETASVQILKEYAESLDTLYGKTFRGFLWKQYIEDYKETCGYDYSDIPMGNAAWYICDYDQDGEAELLVVSANADHTLLLTMCEVAANGEVRISASFLAVADRDGIPFPIYAVEQGEGRTDVFVYDYHGPKICIETVGEYMNATGRRHAIMALTYDRAGFAQYAGPYFDTSSGGYFSDMAEDLRRSFEVFGTRSVTEEDLEAIYLFKSPFMEYLQGVREIYRAEATVTVEDSELFEWFAGGADDRIEVTSIYFRDEDELYRNGA